MKTTAAAAPKLRPAMTFSALALALTLTACGAENADDDAAGAGETAGTAGASAEGTATDDSADSEAPEENAEESEAAPEESEPADEEPEAEPAELPGGGQTLFPDRRFAAAYGSPGIPGLGVLGETEAEDTAERVKFYAEQYQKHSEEPVQPAFEIITSVATGEPGADGDYSNALDPEVIEPWVELAADEDIYVVLDLQPGLSTFLDQAKLYEDLLAQPHVGLALDSEWRLREGQRHMQQIGSVTAEEINEVSDWLAQLTAEEELPQKMLMLHQFKHTMIQNREAVDTSHDELAIVLHADGHGTPDLKLGTYDTLQEGLSEDIWLGWKNFYDEDSPTFTSEQTYEVDPKPWFVSYQ
ncbi:hypothetical protein [Nesterenkonia halotolerans]|uniref:Lipoprotein n=1 Tax=Nesterenkonia halotolerans TaxID=225325 RepID=A0ABR9JAB7_9MICC|nr:hypothetical protein [Nesterenkonia halotolerans]MBE1515923.1 hypothetical protein [Nesterenkonia halotolerans]